MCVTGVLRVATDSALKEVALQAWHHIHRDFNTLQISGKKLVFYISLVVKYNYIGICFGDETAKLLWLADDKCVKRLIKKKWLMAMNEQRRVLWQCFG